MYSCMTEADQEACSNCLNEAYENAGNVFCYEIWRKKVFVMMSQLVQVMCAVMIAPMKCMLPCLAGLMLLGVVAMTVNALVAMN
jgi:hypothetical protein